MAALHFPVAEQVNASIAGMTGYGETPVASVKTAAEHFADTVRTEAGGLGFLFGHDVTNAVDTPLERATSAVRGVAGGLVPSHSTNFPGAAESSSVSGVLPTPFVEVPVDLGSGVLPTPLVETVQSDWQRLRSRLGL